MDVRRTGQVRRVATLLALLAVLALTACGWEGSGVVVDKTYSESYISTSMICAGYNAQSVCTVWVPSTTTIPESWNLKVRDSKGDVHEVSVNKPYWDAAKTGDAFSNKD